MLDFPVSYVSLPEGKPARNKKKLLPFEVRLVRTIYRTMGIFYIWSLNQKVMGSLDFAFRLKVLWRESSRKGTWIIELWFHTVDGRIPQQPPGMYDKNPIDNERNYQPQLVNARFQPSTENMFWSNLLATYFCRVGNYPKMVGFCLGSVCRTFSLGSAFQFPKRILPKQLRVDATVIWGII